MVSFSKVYSLFLDKSCNNRVAKVTMTIWEVLALILVLDAGNSNIVLGVYNDNDQLAFHWRMVTDLHKTEDEYAMQVLSFLITQAFHLNKLQALLYPQLCHQLCFH